MAGLPRGRLDPTGFEVTRLGFGAREPRGAPDGPEITDGEAERLLNLILDEGNFIDTSIDYGRSEERIGKFISYRRSKSIVTSTCGCIPGNVMGAPHVHTAENIR